MKLYGTVLSPFVVRTLLVARAKGQEIEPIHPPGDGEERAAYMKINPSGKMPFLDDEGFYLSESPVIADYFDDVLPGRRLWPTEPRERARHALLTRLVDVWICAGMIEVQLGHRDQREQRVIDDGRNKLVNGFRYLEYYRNGDHEWLAGDEFGHADATIIPVLFALERFNAQNGLWDVVVQNHPDIVAYWKRAKTSPLGSRSCQEMNERADLLFGVGSQSLGLGVVTPKMAADLTAAAAAAKAKAS